MIEVFARVCRVVVFVLGVLLSPLSAIASEQCEKNGIGFGFFNGVQNTWLQADGARRKLEDIYGPITPDGEPITYELFYNDTEGFADFVETFEQRLAEHGGLLAGRFELFFSATKGEGPWWNTLIAAVPMAKDVLSGFFDLFRAAVIRHLTSGLGDPDSVKVAERHKSQIGQWVGRQKGMLLMAHSQGNLFVNLAYAHALTLTDAGSVRVVHVAPASPTLSGPHALADKDLVINGLRLVGAVAPNTDRIPGYAERPPGLNGERDLVGHGLLEIYLNPALPTAARTHEQVRVAFQELGSSAPKPRPPFPEFEPHPWSGGPAPVLVRSPDDVSHRLDKVVYSYSAPRTFAWRDGLWTEQPLSESEEEDERRKGWDRVDFVGKGMGGYRRCSWGRFPLEGWADPVFTQECTFDRVPLDYRFYVRAQIDELAAYGTPPNGTLVRLNTVTRSSVYVHVGGSEAAGRFVQFMSGIIPLWFSEIRDQREWSESFVLKEGGWVNPDAYQTWLAAWEAHQTSELRRLKRYQEAREAYEARDCAGT